MVDALVLGTSVFGRVGSSPTFPTTCPDGGMVDTRDKAFRRINKVLLRQDKDFKQMNEIVDPWDIQDIKCYWRHNKEKCTNRKYAKND